MLYKMLLGRSRVSQQMIWTFPGDPSMSTTWSWSSHLWTPETTQVTALGQCIVQLISCFYEFLFSLSEFSGQALRSYTSTKVGKTFFINYLPTSTWLCFFFIIIHLLLFDFLFLQFIFHLTKIILISLIFLRCFVIVYN